MLRLDKLLLLLVITLYFATVGNCQGTCTPACAAPSVCDVTGTTPVCVAPTCSPACTAPKVCDTTGSTPACVDCLVNTDCKTAGQLCSGNKCVTGACAVTDTTDSNPCNNNGDGGATCVTSSASSYVCSCSSGYIYKSGSCEDIDECSGSNPCSNGSCKNSAGSYSCSCNTGYSLQNNGKSCVDVDECASSSTCRDGGDSNASCLNTPGSYTCFCSDGYSSDGKKCTSSSSGASAGLQAIGNFFSGVLTIIFLPIILPIALLAQIFSGRSSKSFPRITGGIFSRGLARTDENLEGGFFETLLLKLQEFDLRKHEL